ncbi:MAG: hypothetical protein FWE29_00960 [Defluviitaleaceae bacterium]|nr:hypothetical protein [Defluviitaleaceae bacterium]
MAKTSKNNYAKQQNRYSLRVVIFFVVFSVLAIAATIIWQNVVTQQQTTISADFVRVPRVTTSLFSIDGEPRSVTAVFFVEADPGMANAVDSDVVSSHIRTILAGGDYYMLTGTESVEYARNLINENLPNMMDVSNIANLYIVDLQAGNPNRFFIDDDPVSGSSLNDFLRGLRFN